MPSARSAVRKSGVFNDIIRRSLSALLTTTHATERVNGRGLCRLVHRHHSDNRGGVTSSVAFRQICPRHGEWPTPLVHQHAIMLPGAVASKPVLFVTRRYSTCVASPVDASFRTIIITHHALAKAAVLFFRCSPPAAAKDIINVNSRHIVTASPVLGWHTQRSRCSRKRATPCSAHQRHESSTAGSRVNGVLHYRRPSQIRDCAPTCKRAVGMPYLGRPGDQLSVYQHASRWIIAVAASAAWRSQLSA